MKILISVFFLIIFTSKSFAEKNIVFLNTNYIFNNSISGKKANEIINKKTKKLQSDIKKFSSSIKVDKENLAKQKNILSENDYKDKFNVIDKKIKNFNSDIKKRNNEIKKLKKEIRKNFIIELSKILNQYSQNNSIDLIIEQENIVVGSNKLNITNEILKLVNSEKMVLIN